MKSAKATGAAQREGHMHIPREKERRVNEEGTRTRQRELRHMIKGRKEASPRRLRVARVHHPLARRTPPGGERGTGREASARREAARGRFVERDRASFDERGGCSAKEQIVKTKPDSQWIVTTRPLYHLQKPVSYSSRLQVIHRPGSGNCDRSRLMQYGCAWLPPGGR